MVMSTEEKREITFKLEVLELELRPHLLDLIQLRTRGLELILSSENAIDILPKKRIRVILK
jgi:hypothetical protein